MKTQSLLHCFFLLGSLSVNACTSSPSPSGSGRDGAAAPIVVAGLALPESALHDPVADVYLVSNLSGHPSARDHEGFISKISPDGRLLALRFIDGAASPDGLSSPKGMALVGRMLYVADIDMVRTFDADTGTQTGVIPVPNSVFLNDVAASDDGTVYVSDSGIKDVVPMAPPSEDDAIFAIRDGNVRRLAGGSALGHPNGILWHKGKLEVVTLGTGEWLTLDSAGAVTARTKLPGGMLDGIIALEDGTFLASSWETSSLYQLGANRTATLAMADVHSPADVGYDRKRRALLVPQMMLNRLLISYR